MVVGVGALLEGVEHLLARPRGVDPIEDEGGHAAQGHGRERSQGPDADPGRPQQIRIAVGAELTHAAVAEDQLDALDLGGDVAQLGAGAVGAGRDRAGDRLAVDVAEVLHRQPEPGQFLVEVGEHGPGADLDQARGGVGVEHALQGLDPDHRAAGHRRFGERVAGAGDADLAPGLGSGDHRTGKLIAVGRANDLDRPAALVPRPVDPGGINAASLIGRHSGQPSFRPVVGPPAAPASGRHRQP